MSSKEEIRAKLNIADLIGEYVQLTSAGGGRFKGLCPFHKEKTPSFQVDAAQGYFYCFGCKAGGDVFSFLMQVESLDFGDALRKLAERTGVQLVERYGERVDRDLYDVNAFALAYFREHLTGTTLDYLKQRGLLSQTIEDFELGFAPPEWDGLLKRAKARGLTERQLLDAGLLAEHPETGRIYDRFRDRVMFPIRDHLGRLVGFGGRVLDDRKPKYLNTPETSIFKKGELLYGFDRARELARSGHELIAVEGYMDVMMMHQCGFKTAVATLGTALTTEHALLLARLGVEKLALMFDRDEAGQRATLAGLDQIIGSKFSVRALLVPDGKDPADSLLTGSAALEQALAQGLSEVDFRVDTLIRNFGTHNNEAKRKILQALLPRMKNLDPLDDVASQIRSKVAERLGINEQALLEWINSKARRKQLSDVQIEGMLTTTNKEEESELELLKAILQSPHLLSKLDGVRAWRNETVKKVILAARDTQSASEIISTFAGQPEQQLLIRLLFEANSPGLIGKENVRQYQEKVSDASERAVYETLSKLSIDEMREEIALYKQQVANASGSEQMDLLRQISELQRAVEAEKRSRKLQA